MRVFAGVDIGGTATKVGVMGAELKSTVFATPQSERELIDGITEAVLLLSGGAIIGGVGIGCPGAVTPDGKVKYMPNLHIENFDVANLLSKKLSTVVAVTNDANAAALGECRQSGLTNAVMLTLGTGVGSGIVIDGRIYEGYAGEAAELGHMIIEAGGRKCGCGMKGCLEAYASASALIESTKDAMKANKDSEMWRLCPDISDVTGKLAFDGERLGDRAASEVVARYVKYLAIGIVNICNIFRPQAVIIGGGVSNQGENLLSRLRAELDKCDYGYKFAPRPQILRASLGEYAGLYGAIAMIKNKVEENIINERP